MTSLKNKELKIQLIIVYITRSVTVSFFVLFYFSVKLEQGTVTSLIEENGIVKGVQYKTKDGEEVKAYASLTVVCDGCFSNLRRSLCSPMVKFASQVVS